MREFIRRAGRLLTAATVSVRTTVLIAGGVAGCCLLTCWHQIAAQLGWSWTAVAAGLAVLAVAVEWSLAMRVPRRITPPLCGVALATWTAVSPWIAVGVARVAGGISLETLASPAVNVTYHTVAAVLLLALPGLVAGWLVRSLRRPSCVNASVAGDAGSASVTEAPGESVMSLYLTGLAVAAMLDALVGARLLGVSLAGVLGAALGAVWLIVRSSGGTVSRGEDRNLTISPTGERPSDSVAAWLPVAACVGIGALIPLAGRVVDQLFPGTSLVAHAWWGALVAGAAIGLATLRRRRPQPNPRGHEVVRASLLAAATFAIVCGAFPTVVDWSLTLSSTVGTASLLVAARSLLLALAAVPLGMAAGSCLRSRLENAIHHDASIVRRGCFAALMLGAIVSQSALIPAGLVASGVVVSALLLVLAAGAAWRIRFWPQTRWSKLGYAAALTLVLAAPWLVRSYEPERSARLLFSTSVFTARQLGIERQYLAALDETRVNRTLDTPRGTMTLWHSRGAQVQLRSNGIPAGYLSRDPVVVPQYSADLLHATLPLTLHDAPRRVLILGNGAGMPLLTTLAFPIVEATCVEADGSLTPLLAERAWPAGDRSPLADDRVTFRTLEPALAVAARAGDWDVILSTPPQSALFHATAEYTREFYERSSRQLAADGIFCQRFSHVDYGPEPILTIARTMQGAFREVAAIEGAPGEMLLLATNSEQGLVRAGFVERLQAPHVRRLLSRTGWDWCVPLNLTAYNHEGLAELAKASPQNTAANGRLAARLPWELIRWAPKWQETVKTLTPKATRLLAWPTIDSGDPDLLGRLAEVAGQRTLMQSYPDQPWSYRKTLRERLEKSNRSVIIQASGGGAKRDLHPDDRFRKQYFEALGKATREESPSADSLDRLASYLDPYDPLIHYFAHHELADLHRKGTAADPAAELRCRLHMAWYADSRDRSIRSIARALELLNGDGVAVDPADRYDHINGLLQLLTGRWELRGRYQPVSTQVAMNDIDMSLDAAEKSLDLLDKLGPEIGQPAAEVAARRTVLERSLIRPLQTYRGRLAAKHLSETRKTRKALEEAGVLEEPVIE